MASPIEPVADTKALLGVVRDLIIEVVGEDYILDIEIDMETSFADDLEMESLEFVTLAEKLHERFGERVDFIAWFGEFELDEIIALTVGELVTYVETCLS